MSDEPEDGSKYRGWLVYRATPGEVPGDGAADWWASKGTQGSTQVVLRAADWPALKAKIDSRED